MTAYIEHMPVTARDIGFGVIYRNRPAEIIWVNGCDITLHRLDTDAAEITVAHGDDLRWM
jgi:hypothetical protein